jgi:hypothetical protein
MKHVLLLQSLLQLVLFSSASAQATVKDSSISMVLIKVSYAYQVPGGEIARRFGNNSNIAGTLAYKTRSNWIFGIDGGFLFGTDVKESGILDSISSKRVVSGIIIDESGQPASVHLNQRGFTLSLLAGKLFPVWGPNPNSGLLLTARAGFFQHKIRIEDLDQTAPQLAPEYLRGYDRRTNGLALTGFVGYQYLSNRRLINFYAGIEFLQGFTRNTRYDFDLNRRDNSLHRDYLSSLRVGWLIPLYKRAPNEFYYY